MTSRTTVKELLDQFLAWTQDNRAEATYEWYLFHLQRFADFIGPKMQVAELLPGRVDAWLKKDYREASDTGKNGAVRALSRAFNWARKQRLIKENPLSGMERPAAEPREVYLSEEQWTTAVGTIKDTDPLLDLVLFLRETGCRPFEARIAEARHWDGKGQIVFERRNSKGKRSRRVIRLNEAAQHIIRKLALKYPEGPLFRNRRGNPWTTNGIDQAFAKIAKKVGFSFFPYAVRAFSRQMSSSFHQDGKNLEAGPLAAFLRGERVQAMFNHVDDVALSALRACDVSQRCDGESDHDNRACSDHDHRGSYGGVMRGASTGGLFSALWLGTSGSSPLRWREVAWVD